MERAISRGHETPYRYPVTWLRKINFSKWKVFLMKSITRSLVSNYDSFHVTKEFNIYVCVRLRYKLYTTMYKFVRALWIIYVNLYSFSAEYEYKKN